MISKRTHRSELSIVLYFLYLYINTYIRIYSERLKYYAIIIIIISCGTKDMCV